MDTTFGILVNLLTTQFRAEYDAVVGMLDRLPRERTITVRMSQSGTSGTIGETIAKDAAKAQTAGSLMAQNFGQSTNTMAENTKSHLASVDQSIGNVAGAAAGLEASTRQSFTRTGGSISGLSSTAKSEATSIGGFMESSRKSVSSVVGPLSGILPMAATVGFGSLLLGATTTAHGLKTFEQQAGVSIDVAKQWVGAANAYQIPPRALSMTLKNLGQMLNNVEHASGTSQKEMQKDATLTYQLRQETELLAIKKAELTHQLQKYGNSSTQAASAEMSVQRIEEQMNITRQKLNATTTAAPGLTAKQAQALQQLGVSLTDTNGKTLTTTELIKKLADAYQNSTDKQSANAAITQVLGGRAYALLPLIEQGGAALQQALDDGGKALAQYNQKNVNSLDTAGTAIHSIEDTMKNALANIAADMTPAIKFIGDHINEFKTAAEVIGGLYLSTKGFGLLKNVIGDALAIPKQVAEGWGKIASTIDKMTGIKLPGAVTGGSVKSNILSEATGKVGVQDVYVVNEGFGKYPGGPGGGNGPSVPPVVGGGAGGALATAGRMAESVASRTAGALADSGAGGTSVGSALGVGGILTGTVLGGVLLSNLLTKNVPTTTDAFNRGAGPGLSNQNSNIYNLRLPTFYTASDYASAASTYGSHGAAPATAADATAARNKSSLAQISTDPVKEYADLLRLIKSGAITTQPQVDAFVKSWSESASNVQAVNLSTHGIKTTMTTTGGDISTSTETISRRLGGTKDDTEVIKVHTGVLRTASGDAAGKVTDFTKSPLWTPSTLNTLNSISDNVHGVGGNMGTIGTSIRDLNRYAALAAQNFADFQAGMAPLLAITKGRMGALRNDVGNLTPKPYSAGGITNYPASGGLAILHGVEAVVPKDKASPALWAAMQEAINGNPNATAMSPNATIISSGSGGGSGGGGLTLLITGNTLLSEGSIDELVRTIERRLTTVILPNAGRRLTF